MRILTRTLSSASKALVNDVDLLLRIAFVLGVHLGEHLEHDCGDLLFAQELLQNLERPGQGLGRVEKIPHGPEGRLAILYDAQKCCVLFFAVGDARVHANGEPGEQRAKCLIGTVAREHLDRLISLVLLSALVCNARDVLREPARATFEHIEKPHDG
ncbi:MAG: hypothetical protein JRF55_10635 [Deltaproteobacteria bacterium]|nr:hypothetical protein [Deltaproteobacteria bacterium]